MTRTLRIVVLNYNGRDLLPQCLPSLVQSLEASRWPAALTVLDNQSTDEGLDWLRAAFPQVEIVRAPENLYLGSYNAYLKTVEEDGVVLLNNDIRVDPGFLNPLAERLFASPDVFLVAPRVMDFDGKRLQGGRSRCSFRLGFFECTDRFSGFEAEADKPSETDSAGYGAFDRQKFLRLGGYDFRYLPGIFEDVDLCYRAKQAGYKLYYEPRSVVYHLGQASFKKAFGSYRIAHLAHRNHFLFMWKNFRGLWFWIPHLFWLPWRLAFALLKGNLALIHGFWSALTSGRDRGR